MPGHAASFTVDLEPDCPPFLWTWRGVEEGMPRLLDMLAAVGVTATFFTTGDVARRYPAIVRDLAARGHELACHGMSHRPFDRMSRDEARREIVESAAILREFAEVTSFRAPYLRFPREYLPLLTEAGFDVDSSTARYKREVRVRRAGDGWWARVRDGVSWFSGGGPHAPPPTLHRIPASITSSALRAWDVVRWPWLRSLPDPVVLFVHPWEFVDLTRERLRWDCRLRTGDVALHRTREVLADFQRRRYRFVTIRELAASHERAA